MDEREVMTCKQSSAAGTEPVIFAKALIHLTVTRALLETLRTVTSNYQHKHEAVVSLCAFVICVSVRAAARRCLCSTRQVSWTWSSSVWRDTHITWSWPYLLVGKNSVLLMQLWVLLLCSWDTNGTETLFLVVIID